MAKFIDVKFQLNFKPLKGATNLQRSQVKNLPREAFRFFQNETPIDTGNAKRNTFLRNNTIHADYAYAGRLDNGWSKQAKRGMTVPTQEYIAQRFRQIFGGKR
jgi:hypothetical protein